MHLLLRKFHIVVKVSRFCIIITCITVSNVIFDPMLSMRNIDTILLDLCIDI